MDRPCHHLSDPRTNTKRHETDLQFGLCSLLDVPRVDDKLKHIGQKKKAGAEAGLFRFSNLVFLETVSVFSRINETENHVTVVAGIVIESLNPVRITDRVRVATQVTEILH